MAASLLMGPIMYLLIEGIETKLGIDTWNKGVCRYKEPDEIKMQSYVNGDEKEKEELDDQLYDKIENLCDIDNLTIPNEVPPVQQFIEPAQPNQSSSDRQVQTPQFPKFQVNIYSGVTHGNNLLTTVFML